MPVTRQGGSTVMSPRSRTCQMHLSPPSRATCPSTASLPRARTLGGSARLAGATFASACAASNSRNERCRTSGLYSSTFSKRRAQWASHDRTLFDAYGYAKRALEHMEEFVRALQMPLLQALRDAAGGGEQTAALFWKGGRLGRTRWGRISTPFRVPANAPTWRVRAGVITWTPPAAFFIQAAPEQRWDRRVLSPAARAVVDQLTAGSFDRTWMQTFLALTDDLVTSNDLEERVLDWAHLRFVELVRSGLFELPIDEFGTPRPPDDE